MSGGKAVGRQIAGGGDLHGRGGCRPAEVLSAWGGRIGARHAMAGRSMAGLGPGCGNPRMRAVPRAACDRNGPGVGRPSRGVGYVPRGTYKICYIPVTEGGH